MAFVAIGTTELSRAPPRHAKFPQGLQAVGVPHWRSGRRGGSFYYRCPEDRIVSKAVKKAISLPADLAAEAEAIAREENKSLSAVVQDALRALKRTRLRSEFRDLQGYWSTRARAKGVLSERELERLLRR